jgi:hypothetical protein
MVTETAGGGSLTDIEQRLVDHVTRGKPLDLAADEPVDEAAMRSWGRSRTVRAVVLREILCKRLPHDRDVDLHVLRLRGVCIDGRLDLENLTIDVALELYHCVLIGGLIARDATLPRLYLFGCRLEHTAKSRLDAERLQHTTDSQLDAERLTTTVLALNEAVITADSESGAVQLRGAHIRNDLNCTDTRIRNDSGPALRADGLQVDQNVSFRGLEAIGVGDAGAVRLLGAHLGGQLSCTDAKICNSSGPALNADSLQVDLDVSFGGLEAIGIGDAGAVRLPGAHIGSQLSCIDAKICNSSGPALNAYSLQVDQDVFLRSGFKAVGAGEDGAVRLLGAHFGGQLDCTDAKMRNNTGPALSAERLQVDQNVFLHRLKTVGGIQLVGAHVRGGLDCTDAKICNSSGPALSADSLQVDQDVSLRGVKAIGAGERGAVRLVGAHIRGTLDCPGTTMRNDSGSALNAENLQVDQNVFLDEFEAVGAGSGTTLDLRQVRIGGRLAFIPTRLKHTAHPQQRLALDGLTYAGLPASSLDWLDLLREATPEYAAQPYQQVAAAHRAAGDDDKVRRTLIRQRQDQIDRSALTHAGRVWAWVTRVTLGYGYKPWRALWFLVAVAAIAVALSLFLGAHGGVARKPPAAGQCSAVEQVGVGLDLGLPLIETGIRDHCDTTTSSAGQVLTVVGWGLKLLAAALAALFLAGFTGAVRKT